MNACNCYSMATDARLIVLYIRFAAGGDQGLCMNCDHLMQPDRKRTDGELSKRCESGSSEQRWGSDED